MATSAPIIAAANVYYMLIYQLLLFGCLSYVDFRPLLQWLHDIPYSIPAMTLLIQIVMGQLIIFVFDWLYTVRSLDSYKSNKKRAWPFLDGGVNDTANSSSSNSNSYKQKIADTYRKYYYYIGPQFIVFVLLSNGLLSRLDTSDNIPSLWYMYLQANVVLIFGDFFFYWAHRLLHQARWYPFHKEHH